MTGDLVQQPDDGTAGAGNKRALASLMLASFAIGTGEFVIVGLVLELASDLRVSVPTAGLLISVYALSVAFGSHVVAALLSSASPRRALLVLMLLFVAGDAACAVAPGFGSMMAARVVTALAHGAFFGIASVVAAELAPPGKGARAVALLFTGLTVANVVGVPIGTWIGQMTGWQTTFALVAVLAVASLAAMMISVPRHSVRSSNGIRHELATLRQPQIWLAMLISTLSSAALFSVLTFLTPPARAQGRDDAARRGPRLVRVRSRADRRRPGWRQARRPECDRRDPIPSRGRCACPPGASWPGRAVRTARIGRGLRLGVRRLCTRAALATPGPDRGVRRAASGVDAEPVRLQPR